MENLISRITINPNVCHGKPTVRNMRWPQMRNEIKAEESKIKK